jgi:hypothetical protein
MGSDASRRRTRATAFMRSSRPRLACPLREHSGRRSGSLRELSRQWINEHRSIGLLARVTYASMQFAQTSFSDGSVSERNTLVAPSLEASFASH